MPTREQTVVFVHGWSVTNTATYGGLPRRLTAEAANRGTRLAIRHVYLGRYISFDDQVRLTDVSEAFETAVQQELKPGLADGTRFACITHSTGGPVIRDWWHRYYDAPGSGACPMSHVVMLAPANFGSALAQLGKSRVGRLKAWMGGIEPGQGILDWLELGSAESWAMNAAWIRADDRRIGANGVLPFVLTGQSIDRAFYDHLNSYTGESGSDGVVRVAAANLNAALVTLEQQPARSADGDAAIAPVLDMASVKRAPDCILRVIAGAAHAGRDKGIMRAVRARAGDPRGKDTVMAILDCLEVEDKPAYRRLMAAMQDQTKAIQAAETVETVDRLISRTHYIHDRYSMLVFRVRDDQGNPVADYDLLLTAGEAGDPDGLPTGFFGDRQQNSRDRNILTYYVNYDLMTGSPERRAGDEVIREATRGIDRLGLRLRPRPDRGFVHYAECELPASAAFMQAAVRPNATALVDIRLRRIVRRNAFSLVRYEGGSTRGNFRKIPPGPAIVD